MGKEKTVCQKFQVCQFGLPGFSSVSSENESGVNSYLYTMQRSEEPNNYLGIFVNLQKVLFLASTLDLPGGPITTTLTFNNVTELIGATNLIIGLVNPVGNITTGNTTLVGSTLSFKINTNIAVPGPTYYLMFAVSYTPAA